MKITFTEEQIESFLDRKIKSATAEGDSVGEFILTVLTVPAKEVNQMSPDDNAAFERKLKALGWKPTHSRGPGVYVYNLQIPRQFAEQS